MGDLANLYVDIEQVDDGGWQAQQEEGNGNGEKLVLEDIDCLPELLPWHIFLCPLKLNKWEIISLLTIVNLLLTLSCIDSDIIH